MINVDEDHSLFSVTSLIILLYFTIIKTIRFSINFPNNFETEVIPMKSLHHDQFINFLNQDLGLPSSSIHLAVKQSGSSLTTLPMILWQYGLISLQQLDRIFDWLDAITPEFI